MNLSKHYTACGELPSRAVRGWSIPSLQQIPEAVTSILCFLHTTHTSRNPRPSYDNKLGHHTLLYVSSIIITNVVLSHRSAYRFATTKLSSIPQTTIMSPISNVMSVPLVFYSIVSSVSMPISAAAISKRTLAAGTFAAGTPKWQDFELDPSKTSGGKCVYAASGLTGDWANGSHNVAIINLPFAECGTCLKLTNTAKNLVTYGFVVDEQNNGAMDVGGGIMTDLGYSSATGFIPDAVAYEPVAASNCRVAWTGQCAVIPGAAVQPTNKGTYCG